MRGRRFQEDMTLGEEVDFRRPRRRRVDWTRVFFLGFMLIGCAALWILFGTCAWRALHGL